MRGLIKLISHSLVPHYFYLRPTLWGKNNINSWWFFFCEGADRKIKIYHTNKKTVHFGFGSITHTLYKEEEINQIWLIEKKKFFFFP